MVKLNHVLGKLTDKDGEVSKRSIQALNDDDLADAQRTTALLLLGVSNVIVTRQQGSASMAVSDFGLAVIALRNALEQAIDSTYASKEGDDG